MQPVARQEAAGDFSLPTPLRARRKIGPALSGDPSAPIDMPELRVPRFRAFDDEGPAMPEPPPPRAVYEDDEGPPLQLPP